MYVIFGKGGIHAIKHVFFQKISASLMKPSLATRNSVTMTNFRAHLDMRRHTSFAPKISPENIYPKTCSAGYPGEQSASFQLSTMSSFQRVLKCEAARANTMTGGLDLSFGFPQNGKIP